MIDLPVFAAHAWRTNAELIADVARLDYLRATDRTLDPTYGRGTWWKLSVLAVVALYWQLSTPVVIGLVVAFFIAALWPTSADRLGRAERQRVDDSVVTFDRMRKALAGHPAAGPTAVFIGADDAKRILSATTAVPSLDTWGLPVYVTELVEPGQALVIHAPQAGTRRLDLFDWREHFAT